MQHRLQDETSCNMTNRVNSEAASPDGDVVVVSERRYDQDLRVL